MRIANHDGRLTLETCDGFVDVATASGGRFVPDVAAAYERWDELRAWADSGAYHAADTSVPRSVGPPSPAPRQVFAIAFNYRAHADEGGRVHPEHPSVFTKFPSCLTGPNGPIELPGDQVDWEVELVIVIGRTCSRVTAGAAWDHVAGVTVGQDLSDRAIQLRPPMPQFGMAKSYAGFGPTGPCLVTVDELDDPDDLALGCARNDETMQDGRTSDLIFTVPEIIAELSRIVTLLPGDLVFTGTPAGVGYSRTPPLHLAPGDELTSWVEGVGVMRHTFVPGVPGGA